MMSHSELRFGLDGASQIAAQDGGRVSVPAAARPLDRRIGHALDCDLTAAILTMKLFAQPAI